MAKGIDNFILNSFLQIFFSIFFVLFFISSIILFVKISSLSAVVEVNFIELSKLYIYSMPAVLFFTIPVAFFASAIVSFAKLSFDYELLVLFSLGLSPTKIIKTLLPLVTIVTLFLLTLSLALVPISKQQYKEFLDFKKNSANINIKPSEFGQKFGEWLVYINSQEGKRYDGVVMFSKDALEKEMLIISKSAQIVAQDSISIALKDGKAFAHQKSSLEQIDFKSLIIRDDFSKGEYRFKGVLEHWMEGVRGDKKRAKDLALAILISIFPLISIHLYLAFGTLNPRYQKNRSYLYILGSCFLFYILIYNGSKYVPFISIVAIPPIWMMLSYLIYKRRVLRFY